MKNLGPEGRAAAAGQVLFDAAKSNAAGAAAEDVTTSYLKFLGNISKRKQDGTFDAAFGGPEFAPLRSVIDDLERVSKSALRANKVAHDVSGATVTKSIATGAIFGALASGNPAAAAGLFGITFLGPALAGKLLRSRAYLKWLTYSQKLKPAEKHLALQRLGMLAVRDSDPEVRDALKQLVPVVTKLTEQEQPN
jgi:hypothetical protein